MIQKNMQEMLEHWKNHSKKYYLYDKSKDPEGLNNVCYAGSPIWYNKFLGYFQMLVIKKLFKVIGDIKDKNVLEVGCGTGRFTKLMINKGAKVTGIDLQPDTIMVNRKKIPNAEFLYMSATDIDFEKETFDIVISVTVLQHIPYNEQEKAINEIMRVVKQDGYIIIMENIKHIGPTVFSNSPERWQELFLKNNSVKILARLGQEYFPLQENKIFDSIYTVNSWSLKRYLKNRIMLALSYPIEYLCPFFLPRSYAVHNAFLFKKIKSLSSDND